MNLGMNGLQCAQPAQKPVGVEGVGNSNLLEREDWVTQNDSRIAQDHTETDIPVAGL